MKDSSSNHHRTFDHAHHTITPPIGQTPFEDEKLSDILEHINGDHQAELWDFVRYLLQDNTELCSVNITHVYPSGLVLMVEYTNNTAHRFLPFESAISAPSELKDAYSVLLGIVATQQGRRSLETVTRHFHVLERQWVTDNILRLTLTAPTNTPIHEAGFAYLFDINNGQLGKAGGRYYTLRKAWSDNGQTKAWVDIFVHGDHSGGNWAKNLQNGAVITTKREFPERLTHLKRGQALLIADETSLPTVARLLETWQNPLTPYIVMLCQQASEFDYLNPVLQQIPTKPIIAYINTASVKTHIDELIIKTVQDWQQTGMAFDAVWGATSATLAKQLREALHGMLAIAKNQLIIKVYWRDGQS